MRTPALVLLACIVLGSCATSNRGSDGAGASVGNVGSTASAPPCPKCVRIFDGKSWEGWVPKNGWTITEDGAMRGSPGGDRALHTRTEYGNFRLFVTSRMNPRNGDHLGILFWGPMPAEGESYKKNIQFQSPHGAMWDYYVNKDHIGETRIVRGERIDETWHVTEILANLDKGTMRAAVNGVEVTSYLSPDPQRRTRGPVAMQRHGKGVSEYKDIWIEVDPKEDRLLSVTNPPVAAAPTGPAVKIGRCTGVDGLEETKAAGFDYAELGVASIARMTDQEFDAALAKHKAVGLPTPVANGFLPAEVRVTGPDVNPEQQVKYVRQAFSRMARLGVKTIVFGSGPARNLPDGFPREQAWQQLVEFGKRIAPEAQYHGMVVSIEPLRKQESNIINTAAEGLKLVQEVAHPNFQLMVDFYHLAIEKEDPDILIKAKDHIRHFHFANPNDRVFPLQASEYNYDKFFQNIRKIGFRGGLSVEAKPKNGITQDGPRSVAFLRSALPAAAAPGS
jgi:D-psicose/D-tagatose/L-ribulose 3-epimerase